MEEGSVVWWDCEDARDAAPLPEADPGQPVTRPAPDKPGEVGRMMEAGSEDELIRIGDHAGNLLEVPRKVLEQMVDLLASDGGAEELRAYYQRRLDSPWPDYDARSFGKVEEVRVTELESLEDHEGRYWETYHLHPEGGAPCGIACPKCGAELWRDSTQVLLSDPPQTPIFCKECSWSGAMH